MRTDGSTDNPAPLLRPFAERLNDGQAIAFPTETFYGLLARIDRPAALARIFAWKGRPAQAALPVIAADAATARSLWRETPAAAARLIENFWPGPLTIVLPASERWASSPACGGTGNLGVRVPGSAAARGIAAMAGGALVATSANPSGQPPAMDPATVRAYFGDEVAIAEGPALPPSRGSTILSLAEWPPRLLREGEVGRAAIEQILGVALIENARGAKE
jgi:L-threonylcarbamoyladenylate synthase